MNRSNELASLRSLAPGLSAFLTGCLVWLGSAGFLFFLAIPLLLLGTYLMLFSFAVTKHSSNDARAIAGAASLFAMLLCGWVLWSV
jgi:hypothetical protein